MYPEVKIVWCVSEKGHDRPPEYVRCIEYDTKEYYDYAFNSQVVVDNNVGIRTLGFKKMNITILRNIVKKKGQLCISTWHGTPIKRIGKDQTTRKTSIYYTSTDCMVSGCEYHTKHISEAFYINPNIIKQCGMPRNDILFKNIDKEAMKRKLGLPIDRAIVLYAPTFRDSVEDSGIKQLKDLDIKELLKSLKIQFKKEFIFVIRVHHMVLKEIEESGVLQNTEAYVYNGNEHDDMAEYLYVTDVLITDYSGSMIDAAIVTKPCFLYIPDFNHYRDIERGLYLDYDLLPFPKAQQGYELYNNILNFDNILYAKRIRQFNQLIGNCEIGKASDSIAADIIMYISKEQ